MTAKRPSHIPTPEKGVPTNSDVQGQLVLTAAPVSPSFDPKEVQYRKLKQAYTALIKACIRIQEEEHGG